MTDWKGRAEREAAAILNDHYMRVDATLSHADLVRLLAIAWLQGVNLGSHETLAQAEQSFERLRAEL